MASAHATWRRSLLTQSSSPAAVPLTRVISPLRFPAAFAHSVRVAIARSRLTSSFREIRRGCTYGLLRGRHPEGLPPQVRFARPKETMQRLTAITYRAGANSGRNNPPPRVFVARVGIRRTPKPGGSGAP